MLSVFRKCLVFVIWCSVIGKSSHKAGYCVIGLPQQSSGLHGTCLCCRTVNMSPDRTLLSIKGIVHLNIIFSYMKFNKLCNKDHLYIKIIYTCFLLHVYQNILYSVLSLTWVTAFWKKLATFSKCLPERLCVQYYNMASFPVWLQIQYGRILLFLDRLQIFFEQLYYRLFNRPI